MYTVPARTSDDHRALEYGDIHGNDYSQMMTYYAVYGGPNDEQDHRRDVKGLWWPTEWTKAKF
jgi:hypothetical protein